MEAHRIDDDVTDSNRDLKKLQSGGDSASRGVQFKHHDPLLHSIDFQPGEVRNPSSNHSRAVFQFGQSRRIGAAQSGYPGQGAAYPTRHFSWYKPNQPCLPAVGEEEAERTQLRASPLAETFQNTNETFSNHEDSATSPLRNSNSSELLSSQESSVSSSNNFNSSPSSGDSGNIPILSSAIHTEGLSISDSANLARNSNGK